MELTCDCLLMIQCSLATVLKGGDQVERGLGVFATARCNSEASDSVVEACTEAECILDWFSMAQRSLATVETFAFHWSKGVCVF